MSSWPRIQVSNHSSLLPFFSSFGKFICTYFPSGFSDIYRSEGAGAAGFPVRDCTGAGRRSREGKDNSSCRHVTIRLSTLCKSNFYLKPFHSSSAYFRKTSLRLRKDRQQNCRASYECRSPVCYLVAVASLPESRYIVSVPNGPSPSTGGNISYRPGLQYSGHPWDFLRRVSA